jgi:hypothetical protein
VDIPCFHLRWTGESRNGEGEVKVKMKINVGVNVTLGTVGVDTKILLLW